MSAAGVGLTSSGWPDAPIGAVLSALFLSSSYAVARETFATLEPRTVAR